MIRAAAASASRSSGRPSTEVVVRPGHRLLVDRAASRRLGRAPLQAADDVALAVADQRRGDPVDPGQIEPVDAGDDPCREIRRRGRRDRRGSAAPAAGGRRRARARARAGARVTAASAPACACRTRAREDRVADGRVAVRPVQGVEEGSAGRGSGERRLGAAHRLELPLEREGGGRSEELRMQRRPGGSQRTPALRPGVRSASSWPGQGVARLSGWERERPAPRSGAGLGATCGRAGSGCRSRGRCRSPAARRCTRARA